VNLAKRKQGLNTRSDRVVKATGVFGVADETMEVFKSVLSPSTKIGDRF